MTDIRVLTASDEPAWRELWTAYLTFYETEVPQEVYATTFQRLLSSDTNDYNCLVAVTDGKLVGIAHYLFHRHCWSVANVTYLQDLYVEPGTRGTGTGRALIEAVFQQADAAGCPKVYWMTQDFNATARRLYDRIGEVQPFVKYQRVMS